MKEQYRNVCRKMIEHYSEYLTEKEVLALEKILRLDNYDNFNIIIFINKLIDRIWQLTLTKPSSYKEGHPFTFLITRDLLPNEFNLSGMTNFKNSKNFFLEIISDDTVSHSVNGINGFIVEIDYTNIFSEPILPIDFIKKKRVRAKAKLDILGIFNISLGLKKYDAEEELSSDFAELVHLPKIDINKAIYNFQKNNKVLDSIDKESLANIIIVYYLIENNYDKTKQIILYRDILKSKYKTYISKEYIKYFNNKITLDEFITNIFKKLESEELLQMFDKNK